MLPIFFCVWLGSAVTAGAAREAAASPELRTISRHELAAAAAKGEPVTRRLIDGKDIAAVLAAHQTSEPDCMLHGGLQIEGISRA